MGITLMQAVLIGLWTGVCNVGMLYGIYTARALVLSFGVGLILGDLQTAVVCGAVAELAFMGFGVGIGGAVPPNPMGPGLIGTLMAITMHGVTPQSALALSIPFAIAIQFLQTFIYASCSGLPEAAGNALKARNFRKFKLVSNTTAWLFMLFGFGIGFLGAFSMDTLKMLVNLIPDWLLNGLSVAGGMLPAIGFGMVMTVMLKRDLIPFALLGYALAAFLKLPVVGIAIIALVFALKHYFAATAAPETESAEDKKTAESENHKEAQEDASIQ